MNNKIQYSGPEKSSGFSASEIDQFRKESPLSDAYASPFPGIKLFHQQRIKAILELLGEAVEKNGGEEYDGRSGLMEFGCGDGFLIEKITEKFITLRTHAVDISYTALRRARNRAPAASLIQSDAENTPFTGETFDIALCSEVLEHVPDDVGLLKEIFRILRPGAFFVLTTPNLFTLRNVLRQKIGREPKIEFQEHLREYAYRELVERITSTGFSIVKFRSVGFYIPKMHWFFKSRLISALIFTLARWFPTRGRDFMFLLRKPSS
jgi:SAM-dependent methyltransferase